MNLFMRIPLITRRTYDFTPLGASVTVEVPLIKQLDLTRWRQFILELRVHARTIATGTFTVRTLPVSYTRENPAVDFIDTATFVDVSFGAAASVPDLFAGEITFAGTVDAARIVLRPTQGASGSLLATISVDALLKAHL